MKGSLTLDLERFFIFFKMLSKFSVIEESFNSTSNQEVENKRGMNRIYASLIYQLPVFSDRLLTQFARKL